MSALVLTLLLAATCASEPKQTLVGRWMHWERQPPPAGSLLTILDLYADGSGRQTLVSPDYPSFVEQDTLTYEAESGVFTERITGQTENGQQSAVFSVERPAMDNYSYRLDGNRLTLTLRGRPFTLYRLRPSGPARAVHPAPGLPRGTADAG